MDIVELRIDNYKRWRNDLQVALIMTKCSRVADVNIKPQEVSDEDWQKWSQSARAIILKALRDEFWRVSAEDTPFEILQKIEDTYQPTSALIAILNVCKFFSISNGNAAGTDVVKEITSAYAEMRRSIEACDTLRENITIDQNVRTAVLAFAIEGTEPSASLQIKERFERNAISFEQAVSLLAEVRVTHRGTVVTGGPNIAAITQRDSCTHCNGKHHVSRCWFKDPSLAPEKLRLKICRSCKTVGHPTSECTKGNNGNAVTSALQGGNSTRMSFNFGLYHYVLSLHPSQEPVIIIDSGCTIHMMTTRSLFSDYKEGAPEKVASVYTASGQPLPVVGHGSVTVGIRNVRTGVDHDFRISDVLHVPDLKENFISVCALDKKGVQISLGNQKMILRQDGKFVASAHLEPRMQQYCLQFVKP